MSIESFYTSMLYLIEFLHQTTTRFGDIDHVLALYLIEFLHQTTTFSNSECAGRELYLIEFLHQTTTGMSKVFLQICCILLNFYIKPQQWDKDTAFDVVVSY